MKLADVLREARKRSGATLRQIEQETGISNGYLSLLETGAAKNPSPDMLEKLATRYGASYELLMELSGHRPPRRRPTAADVPGLLDGMEDLSTVEMEQLRAFVGYLRSRRGQ